MKTKSFILIVTIMLSFLIPIKGNCFIWPYYVCFDPGHGGNWPGTLGWEYMGPGEKVHTLSACQVLDEELYYSYDVDGLNFVMLHTRIDDSHFYYGDDYMHEKDLHARAEIANGNRPGWRNMNYDTRGYPPASYGTPWWTSYTYHCDFFVSYHYNASNNYSAKDTRCYYQMNEINEDERRLASEHMISEIVNAVQDVLVLNPAEGSSFHFSATAGSAFESDLQVLRDLDYSQVQKGGVLVEPLFYTHYDSWRALNCTDPTDFVEFNICVGIDEAIYKYLKGIPVGFEDDIQITACPDYMEQNTSVSIDACFSDYPPDNQLGWVSCKLFAATREGSVLLNETGALPDGQGNMYFDLDVPHLSNWNKVWLRSSTENNYIKAQITLSGTEDDGTVLTTHYDVLIESPPTTSGEISLNEMWAGNLTITGDITIQEDILLYIAPESIIEFSSTDDQSGGYNSSKCELIVDGTLDAEGATFTAENTRDWYGIRFNSTATNCELDSCTIENADYNVRITGSSPLIDQCTFDGGLYAVIVESDGADPTVRKCDIKNVNYGIRLQTDTEGDYYDNRYL